MSSSNRHWPSMFKSKPTSNNQFHHDLNFPNPRNSYTQDEERTPEPKPRWNPRPEQIRILEGIFNSGTVNPPRDEIRRIRAQLQEFGQVGDANVFYWFQNRKSRSKQKRHLHNTKRRTPPVVQASSSSSSDKSSTLCNSGEKPLSLSPFTLNNSPTAPASVSAAAPVNEQPLFFPICGAASTHGICFPDLSESSDLLVEVMGLNSNKQPQISYAAAAAAAPPLPSSPSAPQGLLEAATTAAAPKSAVFINDVCFEVSSGQPFNVREAFGDDAVLVESSGQPVPTDEWGVTHHPLQHASFYYLLRSFASPPHNH